MPNFLLVIEHIILFSTLAQRVSPSRAALVNRRYQAEVQTAGTCDSALQPCRLSSALLFRQAGRKTLLEIYLQN